MMDSLKKHYTRIYTQTISPDARTLAIGNSEGNIILYDLTALKKGEAGMGRDKLDSPAFVYQEINNTIYSMTSTPELLIAGLNGKICGYLWTDLLSGVLKPVLCMAVGTDQANFGRPEINSLAYDADRNYLYAGCGDWRTRCFDVEKNKVVSVLEGHTDYVHDVVLSQNKITTAGEDGQVLIWDNRSSKEPQMTLHPHKQPALSRPDLGKFISSVDLDKDWLVCGGGPNAGVFHLRSLALTATMPTLQGFVGATKFTRQGDLGSIVVGGYNPTMKVCSISGDVTAEIKPSTPCVHSIHVSEKPVMLMTVGGFGPYLDVCFNLNYKDHTTATI